MTTQTDYGECYLVNSRAYIKNVPNSFCRMFLKNIKNEDGSLKDHVTNLNENLIDLEGKPVTDIFRDQGIRCTLPVLFIELEYKIMDEACPSHVESFLIDHECYLYADEFPTLKDLKNYRDKFSYGFVDLNQEQLDLVNAYHNGYGCITLSEDYE